MNSIVASGDSAADGNGTGSDHEHDRHSGAEPVEESFPSKEGAGALIGTDQLARLLDMMSTVRQLIGSKTDISIPGARALRQF